jgi:hypothetical protein
MPVQTGPVPKSGKRLMHLNDDTEEIRRSRLVTINGAVDFFSIII